MGLSSELSCEAGSFSHCCLKPLFSIRGLRLYFLMLELWVAWSVTWSTSCCLASQLQLCPPCLLHNPPPHWVHQLPPCCEASLPSCPSLPRPTGLDECFFFISLVVGLQYSSIFCQFWLLFVFKLSWSSFWLCEEAQCVYLRLHLGQQYLKLIY